MLSFLLHSIAQYLACSSFSPYLYIFDILRYLWWFLIIIIIIINNNNNNNGRNGSYFKWLGYLKWGRRIWSASQRGLILNKFRIHNKWHIPQRKHCQLPRIGISKLRSYQFRNNWNKIRKKRLYVLFNISRWFFYIGLINHPEEQKYWNIYCCIWVHIISRYSLKNTPPW